MHKQDAFLPYGRQSIDEEDIRAVVDVLRSDWLTTGPAVDRFEADVCAYVGAAHGVAMSSGTAALHAAMFALGIGKGDEVIVTPMTFAASANCILYQGGMPVFADVEADTLLLDPAAAEVAVTPHTRAIIAVDYAGQPCDWDALRAIADKHHSQREKSGAWFYEMTDLGYNYRITDFQCALGSSQIKKLDGWIDKRNRLAHAYDAALAGQDAIRPLTRREEVRHAYHLYVARTPDRDALFQRLRANGIGVNVHYVPVHLHPFYQGLGYKKGVCPVAEAAYGQILTLPLWPGMEKNDVERVITVLQAEERGKE